MNKNVDKNYKIQEGQVKLINNNTYWTVLVNVLQLEGVKLRFIFGDFHTHKNCNEKGRNIVVIIKQYTLVKT